jgi:hypothetical protein
MVCLDVVVISTIERAREVADKMGEFFEKTFLTAIKKMVEASMSYDEVKRRLKIPSTWGAKITGEQFKERATVDKH